MRKYIARGPAAWPSIVFFLTRGPRTRQELAALTGARYDTCDRVIRVLEQEGLVAFVGFQGKAKAWRWAST